MSQTATAETKPILPFMGGVYERLSSFTWPAVRAITGLFLVPHGAAKLFGLGGSSVEGLAGFLTKLGLDPALPFAYLAAGTEFFGGLMLAAGLLTRPVAAAVAILMAVAAFQVHWANGFFWSQGGYEYPLMWGLLALVIAVRGGGEWSMDRCIGYEL
jgi:putative oxidoreductase